MHNANSPLYEVYVINCQGENLSDPATKMEKQHNEQLIPEIGCRLF